MSDVDAAHSEAERVARGPTRSRDDRDTIQPGDRVLLIVENDLTFARFLLDLAHEHGFKALVATGRRRR